MEYIGKLQWSLHILRYAHLIEENHQRIFILFENLKLLFSIHSFSGIMDLGLFLSLLFFFNSKFGAKVQSYPKWYNILRTDYQLQRAVILCAKFAPAFIILLCIFSIYMTLIFSKYTCIYIHIHMKLSSAKNYLRKQ